jgi:hypothetical protein
MSEKIKIFAMQKQIKTLLQQSKDMPKNNKIEMPGTKSYKAIRSRKIT